MVAKSLIPLAAVLLCASAALAQTPPALQHQHETGQPPQRLGTVHFETSCHPDVQPGFNRGLALLHCRCGELSEAVRCATEAIGWSKIVTTI
jgi:hypothetical protein